MSSEKLRLDKNGVTIEGVLKFLAWFTLGAFCTKCWTPHQLVSPVVKLMKVLGFQANRLRALRAKTVWVCPGSGLWNQPNFR